MRRWIVILPALFLALIIGAVVLSARQSQVAGTPTDQKPVAQFRSRVDLVTVDVSVLDRDRRPVKGLAAADFTLLEDGKPQSIVAFDAIDCPDVIREESVRGAAWLREAVPDVVRNDALVDRPVTIIVLDDATPMKAAEVPWVRRMGRAAVDRLPFGDSASVVFTLDKKSGQDFTTDRARLLAAVDRFNGTGDLLMNEHGLPVPFDQFNRTAMTMYEAALDTLRSLIAGLADLPQGRKAIVFISVGLPVGAADIGAAADISTGGAGLQADAARLVNETFRLFTEAQRAGVNIYSISPGGLRAPAAAVSTFEMMGNAAALHPGERNDLYLESLSAGTGAFAAVDTNDYQSAITQVYRENSSYYLLGYVSLNKRTQGRFRKVDVRVNRRDVTVRTRSGYIEPTLDDARSRAASAAGSRRGSSVDQAMAGLAPKSDLPMQVAVAPFAIPGRRDAALAIALAVRQQTPERVTRVVEHIDLRISAFSPDKVRRASRREQVDARLSPGADTAVVYEVLSRMDLAPGRYQLRVAAAASLGGVRANPRAPAVGFVGPDAEVGNKTGSVYCDLDVPDFGAAPLSLSGIVLNVGPGATAGPKERLTSLLPVMPTTQRSFRSDDRVTAFVRVYRRGANATTPAPVTLIGRVVDGDGLTVFEASDTLTPDRFKPDNAADGILDIPVAGFKSGPHLLTVEATLGGTTASRILRFEVR